MLESSFTSSIISQNIVIKKKHNNSITLNTDTLYFIVDQSGSMNEIITENNLFLDELCDMSIHDTIITEEEPEQEINYVKYTLNLMNMKHYQRVIFGFNDTSKWKGKISWNDKTGRKTMLLHDITKWVTIDNPIMNTILNVTNELGHYINISNIS